MTTISPTHIFQRKMLIRFATLLVAFSASLSATAVQIGDFEFSSFNDDGTCKLYGLPNYGSTIESEELNIPATVEYDGKTYTVIAIGNDAFRKKITSQKCTLSIPNSITSIGDYAFADCSGLTGSLILPESLTSIGKRAFEYCSGFTGELIIPNSVTSIGWYAFIGCSGLTGSLTIPESLTTIERGVFMGCSGFNGSLTIPSSVTEISPQAFCSCNGFIGSLTIPSSVAEIGYDAFFNCYGFNGTLNIPNSVTEIGNGAFQGCSGFIGSLALPISLKSIDHNTFNGCSGFTGSLIIPEGVTSIEENAFMDCYGFTGSLTIPEGVTSVGESAFRGCNGFTGTLTLPKSLSKLSSKAFFQCSSIKIIMCEAITPPSMTADAFGGTSNYFNDVVLYVPKESIDKYKKTIPWSSFKNIKSLDEAPSSSIGRVESDEESGVTVERGDIVITGNGVAEVYNLAGVRVAQTSAGHVSGLPHGIYIVSINGKVHKVAL